ncbi:hypothetical protein RRG08_024492 [Elysia crispata]|uniref:Uncharacterized protein n=1 Tax=Elysia crispata TaxID=231223 RepID=A0AAE0YPN5_9GAST|nr:hypothetical protein RRG08_024492 [Elysia crispata]
MADSISTGEDMVKPVKQAAPSTDRCCPEFYPQAPTTMLEHHRILRTLRSWSLESQRCNLLDIIISSATWSRGPVIVVDTYTYRHVYPISPTPFENSPTRILNSAIVSETAGLL